MVITRKKTMNKAKDKIQDFTSDFDKMWINPADDDDEKLDKKKRRKTDKEFVFQFEDMKINSNQEIKKTRQTQSLGANFAPFCHLEDEDITYQKEGDKISFKKYHQQFIR